MGFTLTGTRDQPQVASSGNTPDFAADLTGISDFFAVRSLRRFTTVALLLASSGSGTDDYAVATNAPGALFRNTGAGWVMYGVAHFADSAARATAISAPVAGMRSKRANFWCDEEYNGSAWVSVRREPHAEFTATSGSQASGSAGSVGTLTAAAGETNDSGLFTVSTNTLTVVEAGLYSVSVQGSIPAAPTGAFWMRCAFGSVQLFLLGSTSTEQLGGSLMSAYRLPAGTVLTFTFLHTSAASRVLTSRIVLTKVGDY